jgi:hypothetical protein
VNPALLTVQAVVFALWAGLMFHTLFRLRRWVVARTGRVFPGLGDTIDGWRVFVTQSEFRTLRRALGWVTGLMFVLILLNVLLAKG